MRITKVTLENWGPYKGSHEVDIDVTQDSPLVVVWGGNGKGKTKFIDAMKWVFSGGDLGYIKVGPYINLSAISDGQIFDTSVTVDFFQGDSRFRAKRKISVDPANLPDPDSGKLEAKLLSIEDKSKVALEKIGEAQYTPEEARSVLRRLFPARLVDFYFFDAAELIDSFKTISGSAGSYSSTLDIQNSVETAMGFKGFESYIESLKSLEQDLISKADKDVEDKTKLSKLKLERDGVTANLKVLEEDYAEIYARRGLGQERLENLRKQLEGMDEFVELQKEKATLQDRIKVYNDQLSKLRGAISEQFGSLWAAPMAEQIVAIQEGLASAKDAWQNWQQEIRIQRAKVTSSELEIEKPNCPHCDRPMDQVHRENAMRNLELEKDKLQRLENEIPAHAAEYDETAAVTLNQSMWSPTKTVQLGQMLANMRRISELQVEILTMKNRISQLNVQMGGVEQIDILAIVTSVVDLEEQDDVSRSALERLQVQINSERDKLLVVNKKISSLGVLAGSVARDRLIKVQKLKLELVFILSELKLKVREEIEKEANSILGKLTSPIDKNFKLFISQDYNLSTDKFNPNNGFKQQLILSFLFAIPRVAKAPFPVVIDSPLQHMDVSNRENFLGWATTGLSQLVLLPHDAEIEISEVPNMFGEKLSRFYRLDHDPETKVSQVTRLG